MLSGVWGGAGGKEREVDIAESKPLQGHSPLTAGGSSRCFLPQLMEGGGARGSWIQQAAQST